MKKDNLNKRVAAIEQRNKKVELDKAWETSVVRKILIVVMTYIVITLLFIFAGLSKPFLNSIIPAAAFIISTLSLSYFKTKWINCRKINELNLCSGIILYFVS